MPTASKKIGVLLCQVGTPDAPTKQALLPYLKNFLSDPRVIDINPLLWKPVLHGIVLRTRPARSAELYKEIWTDKGSPLLCYSKAQVRGLQERLGSNFIVELGMAYGGPSIRKAIHSMEQNGISRIVVLPLFPQFSTATTASVFDEAYSAASGRNFDGSRATKKLVPSLRFVGPYYNDPEYIAALASRTKKYLELLQNRPDKFIITFHGIPKRYATEGDPYPEHCQKTAGLLAEAMGWHKNEWILTYQSRFGREEWLGPYTSTTLETLYSQGVKRPCIVAPAFVTDCLETLHELGIEGRQQFVSSGGDKDALVVVPCLNDDPQWLDFLATLVRKNS